MVVAGQDARDGVERYVAFVISVDQERILLSQGFMTRLLIIEHIITQTSFDTGRE